MSTQPQRLVAALDLGSTKVVALIAEVTGNPRDAGARIRLISDGDVAGAIAACRPGSGTDMLAGIGGTPEGIITAATIRCMGGAIQAVLAPTDDAERQKAIDAGHELDKVLMTEDLVSGENVFFSAFSSTPNSCASACSLRSSNSVASRFLLTTTPAFCSAIIWANFLLVLYIMRSFSFEAEGQV